MWKDPIVEEIRKTREEYAGQFGYDLHAICQDIRAKQGKTGRPVVSLTAKPVRPVKMMAKVA
ncbi:hypothetical protein Thiowin_04061 [Thiorhodovibrio winogradskyi]|uniref:Uncharacterized protein n=1 Tax=Thiorhodovibrio winogradskyi TaxID=77007 RepID=A0ABZ0SFT5_9GAMM|nr:hypothetical protein [Thiorhodovibrio winogradskyi]